MEENMQMTEGSLVDSSSQTRTRSGRYNPKGKAKSMGCEMADRSVVASKSKPMIAGNGPEGENLDEYARCF